MPGRLLPSLFFVLSASLVGCADLSSEPLQAKRDEAAQTAQTPPVITTHRGALELSLVVDVAGEPLVVLPGEPDDSWGVGEPTLLARGDVFVAGRDVALETVPAEAKQQLGEKLALFDEHGSRCEAVVSGLSLIVRADPRYDTRDEWDGKAPSGVTTKATPAAIAQEVWTMNAPELVAHVRSVSGTCGGATFARSAWLTAPTMSIATSADAVMTARAVAFVRTTPTFVEIQRGFAAEPPIAGEPPRPARWDDLPYATTQVVTMRAGSVNYAWITIAAEAGCGEFNARYGALVREDAEAVGGFVAARLPESGITEEPRVLVDVGDGAPTMMFRDAMLRPEGGTYRYESQTVWSSECPC